MAVSRMLGAVAAAAVALPVASADAQLRPVKQCVTYNATSGSAQVRLAAFNAGVAIATFPPGDDNYLMPPPLDRNQPNQFLPGFTAWDFPVQADTGAFNWILGGNALAEPFSTASAGLPFERPCAYRGPQITGVTPATLDLGGGEQTLAVFGQGLGVGAKVTIDGVTVDADPSAATANRLDVPVTVGAAAAAGAHDLLVTDADGNQTGCRGCVVLAAPAPAPQGPAGAQGPAGPQGARGDSGIAGAAVTPRTVSARAKSVRAGRVVTSSVACPAGTRVLSGGYALTPARGANPPLVTESRPSGTAWRVTARGAKGARAFRLTASATCA